MLPYKEFQRKRQYLMVGNLMLRTQRDGSSTNCNWSKSLWEMIPRVLKSWFQVVFWQGKMNETSKGRELLFC